MPDHDGGGRRAETPAARKMRHLLAGDYLLYELTGDRQMRVLHLPVRLTAPEGCAGRAFPRGGAAGRRAR
jgi:hypothetical protein